MIFGRTMRNFYDAEIYKMDFNFTLNLTSIFKTYNQGIKVVPQ